ncbi:MAG: NACHT domain-containing protein, partial [Chromatiales bacterium]
MSLKEQLRAKYRDKETYDKLDGKFIELRIQQFRLETLPDTLTERDLVELEKLRQNSPVVPLGELFSKLEKHEDAPKKVLIRGRPGVGKTTLVEYLAREWAIGNLWPEIDYVFVLKLRKLLETANWSLSDLLFGDLELSDLDKTAALDELCQHSGHVLCIVDGLDEHQLYEFSQCRFPVGEKVTLGKMISSIISRSLLPKAKVILTTRPTHRIPPFKEFGRVVDIYGFTVDGIKHYVEKFCAGKEELKRYIWKNIDSNPNMATFCHTPILCLFICEALEDIHEHPESSSDLEMKTMTQMYVKATYRLAKKLHPSLKFAK